jgi:hypothetical protein
MVRASPLDQTSGYPARPQSRARCGALAVVVVDAETLLQAQRRRTSPAAAVAECWAMATAVIRRRPTRTVALREGAALRRLHLPEPVRRLHRRRPVGSAQCTEVAAATRVLQLPLVVVERPSTGAVAVAVVVIAQAPARVALQSRVRALQAVRRVVTSPSLAGAAARVRRVLSTPTALREAMALTVSRSFAAARVEAPGAARTPTGFRHHESEDQVEMADFQAAAVALAGPQCPTEMPPRRVVQAETAATPCSSSRGICEPPKRRKNGSDRKTRNSNV